LIFLYDIHKSPPLDHFSPIYVTASLILFFHLHLDLLHRFRM